MSQKRESCTNVSLGSAAGAPLPPSPLDRDCHYGQWRHLAEGPAACQTTHSPKSQAPSGRVTLVKALDLTGPPLPLLKNGANFPGIEGGQPSSEPVLTRCEALSGPLALGPCPLLSSLSGF